MSDLPALEMTDIHCNFHSLFLELPFLPWNAVVAVTLLSLLSFLESGPSAFINFMKEVGRLKATAHPHSSETYAHRKDARLPVLKIRRTHV